MRVLAFSGLWLFAVATCVQASEPPRPAEVCREHLLTEGRVSPAEWPKVSGEYNEIVVLSYALDGSGKAVDVQVSQGSKRRGFNKLAIEYLSRSSFVPGVPATGCVAVRDFRRQRRS